MKINLSFSGFLKTLNQLSSSLIPSATAVALKLYFPKRLMCCKDAGEIWSKSSSLSGSLSMFNLNNETIFLEQTENKAYTSTISVVIAEEFGLFKGKLLETIEILGETEMV